MPDACSPLSPTTARAPVCLHTAARTHLPARTHHCSSSGVQTGGAPYSPVSRCVEPMALASAASYLLRRRSPVPARQRRTGVSTAFDIFGARGWAQRGWAAPRPRPPATRASFREGKRKNCECSRSPLCLLLAETSPARLRCSRYDVRALVGGAPLFFQLLTSESSLSVCS